MTAAEWAAAMSPLLAPIELRIDPRVPKGTPGMVGFELGAIGLPTHPMSIWFHDAADLAVFCDSLEELGVKRAPTAPPGVGDRRQEQLGEFPK